MKMRITKFPVPVLHEKVQTLYYGLYGDVGVGFTKVLNSSPDEIAVLSILLAYHMDQIASHTVHKEE